MNQEAMDALRAADPAMRARLDAVDPGAFDALRRRIVMTDQTEKPGLDRRLRNVRRGVLAGGLAVLLTGGGVAAYATFVAPLHLTDADVICLDDYDEAAEFSGGPALTGDPVGDCAAYREQQGLPPVEDPVAFVVGQNTYVTPRSEMPAGVGPVGETAADAARVVELVMNAHDVVDGGATRCFTVEEAVAWAEAEVARLGLEWDVVRGDYLEQSLAEEGLTREQVYVRPCAKLEVDEMSRKTAVYESWGYEPDGSVGSFLLPSEVPAGLPTLPPEPAESSGGPSPMPSGEPSPSPSSPGEAPPSAGGTSSDLFTIVAGLRSGIAEQCVTLAEARSVADEELAGLDYEPMPTTSITDESADCARVDMRVGGSVQVTVYGPTTVG